MPDTEYSKAELARYYFLYHRGNTDYEWARDQIEDMYNENPEMAWHITLELVNAAPSLNFLYDVAAGELEMLVRDHGQEFFSRIREEAQTNPKFLYAMTGVWLREENVLFHDYFGFLKAELKTQTEFDKIIALCDVPETVEPLKANKVAFPKSDPFERIEKLRESLRDDPKILPPYLEIANSCIQELPECHEIAASAIESFLESVPNSVIGLFIYARILRNMGDTHKSEETYRTVLGIDPWHRGALVELGNLLFHQNRFSESYELLKHAVVSYVGNSAQGEISARYFLAEASLACEKKEEAVRELVFVSVLTSIDPGEKWMIQDAKERLKNLE